MEQRRWRLRLPPSVPSAAQQATETAVTLSEDIAAWYNLRCEVARLTTVTANSKG